MKPFPKDDSRCFFRRMREEKLKCELEGTIEDEMDFQSLFTAPLIFKHVLRGAKVFLQADFLVIP